MLQIGMVYFKCDYNDIMQVDFTGDSKKNYMTSAGIVLDSAKKL